MKEVYISGDLWLCALFLSQGNAELIDIQVNRNSRTTVSFAFQGENLSQLADKYCKQQAFANVTQLRGKLNFLRDVIFQARKNQKEL